MILGTSRDRNCQNQCPELLLLRVWKGVEEWAFGWNTKEEEEEEEKKKKEDEEEDEEGNLVSVDYI
jgi:hypothetical protein